MGNLFSDNEKECTESPEERAEQGELEMKLDQWYMDRIKRTVETETAIERVAIVSYPDAVVLGVYPKNFSPYARTVREIMDALKGDTAGLAANGMMLGPGCRLGWASKIENNRELYGMDNSGGGTDAFLCDKSLLIGCYFSRPASSTRTLRNLSNSIREQGK